MLVNKIFDKVKNVLYGKLLIIVFVVWLFFGIGLLCVCFVIFGWIFIIYKYVNYKNEIEKRVNVLY